MKSRGIHFYCVSLILCLFIVLPVFAATTNVTVMLIAEDNVTVLARSTVDFSWMESHLPVYGDGVTHYYHQGPVFNSSLIDKWNPGENDTAIKTKDYNAVKGTNVKDLCDLVGGMESDDHNVTLMAPDSYSKSFAYSSVYSPSPRTGPIILTWYRADQGYVNQSYDTGIRNVMFADTSTNPWGYHVFGLWDMHEAYPEEFWYYYSPTQPSATGLSVQNIDKVMIYSNDPLTPIPTSIWPDYGLPGTTVPVIITGSNFSANSVVKLTRGIEEIQATNVVITGPTKITCKFKIPLGIPSNVWNLTITNNPMNGTKESVFSILAGPLPVVNTLTPNTLYPNATWSFTLSGKYFQSGAGVTFNKTNYSLVPSSVSVINPNMITGMLTIPGNQTVGTWDVIVKNPDNGIVTKKNALTVKPWTKPTVTSLTPTTVYKNSTSNLTLIGNFFEPGLSLVFFNRTGLPDLPLGNLSVVNPTKLTGIITVPNGLVEGKYNLVITTVDGGTSIKKDALTVKPWPRPQVSSLLPVKVFINSTTVMTIKGNYFQAGTEVTINRTGSLDIPFHGISVVNLKEISATITVPPGTTPDSWNIIITSPDGGTTVKSRALRISPWLKPTIGTIKPVSGLINTPINFTLTGTNFQPWATVYFNSTTFGDIPSNVSVISLTKITGNVTIPAGAPTGKWNIKVTTPDGGSAYKLNAFTVMS